MSPTEMLPLVGGTQLGPSQGPNRPILELFLKKSCQPYVEGDKGLAFFEWCSEPNDKTFVIDCGISGSAPCPSQVKFVKANDVLAPKVIERVKKQWYQPDDYIGIFLNQQCSWGGSTKAQNTTYIDSFESKQAQAYYTNECYRTAFGEPTMPIWAILLIIVAMLAAVGIAFTIFYYVWLRRRIKGREGMTSSALSSMSSVSAISSVAAVSKRSGIFSGKPGSGLGKKSSMSNVRSVRSSLRSFGGGGGSSVRGSNKGSNKGSQLNQRLPEN